MMKIYLKEILEGRDHKVVFTENDEWFRTLVQGLDETSFPNPERTLSGEITLRKVDETYLLEGKVDLPLCLCCSRCAQDVIQPANKSFHLLFSQVTKKKRDSADDDEKLGEDSEMIHLTDDFIALADIVREQIALEIPLQPLCREDCKGLCDQCGSDMNTQACMCARETMVNQPFGPLQTQLQTQLKKIKTL